MQNLYVEISKIYWYNFWLRLLFRPFLKNQQRNLAEIEQISKTRGPTEQTAPPQLLNRFFFVLSRLFFALKHNTVLLPRFLATSVHYVN